MKGTKLVSDYLTDKKISLWTKQSQMVITDNKDDIVWLVGHRIDHRFRITSSTSLVLKMELQ
jgi:tRNA(Ile)-lysidine synthase